MSRHDSGAPPQDHAEGRLVAFERDVRVVLVEPWEPGNVGAVARAMNNLGASRLQLVVADPDTRKRLVCGDAVRFATHAYPLIESAEFCDDLPEALADCRAVFAFSARTGKMRQPRHALLEAADHMADRLRSGPVALMFGTEERGLSREHLEHATELVRIPAPGPHPVFNLAQSVLLALWELTRATDRLVQDRPQGAPTASSAEREELRRDWELLLSELEYGETGRGTLHHRILGRTMDLLDRGGNQKDDYAMLRGIARAIRLRAGGDRKGSS